MRDLCSAARAPAIERCVAAKVRPLRKICFAENDGAGGAQTSHHHRSEGTMLPTSARDPAVVCILSAVARLSFTRIGMPCHGPRSWPALPSASSALAMASASEFVSITAWSRGLKCEIRWRYRVVSCRLVSRPRIHQRLQLGDRRFDETSRPR
jgi:hypothetical protein